MEKNFSEKESLELIVSMIENAKSNIKTGFGRNFLLWGYLVCLAGLTNFIFYGKPYAWYGWALMMPVGLILGFYFRFKSNKQVKVYTYTDRIVGNVWLAFAISMVITTMPAFGLIPATRGWFFLFYPVLLMFAAMATFVSGIAYRFKPLVYGAIVCWVSAIVCMFINNHRYSVLIYTITFAIAYIIPGHMLNQKEKKDV